MFIEPGSPRENDYIESFNGEMRDALLEREIFFSLKEAQVLIEQWRYTYNHLRPQVPSAIVRPALPLDWSPIRQQCP